MSAKLHDRVLQMIRFGYSAWRIAQLTGAPLQMVRWLKHENKW